MVSSLDWEFFRTLAISETDPSLIMNDVFGQRMSNNGK